MSWYALVCTGMQFKMPVCIPKSSWFWSKILLNRDFGMQAFIYLGTMSWHALVCKGMRFYGPVCISKSYRFLIKLLLNRGFVMQVCI